MGAIFSLMCVCTAEQKAANGESPELLQKIAALELRIANLEKRVAEQSVPAPVANGVQQLSGSVPPAVATPQWQSKPHSINGMQYYIVPLSKKVVR